MAIHAPAGAQSTTVLDCLAAAAAFVESVEEEPGERERTSRRV
jgi:hypothetical protein